MEVSELTNLVLILTLVQMWMQRMKALIFSLVKAYSQRKLPSMRLGSLRTIKLPTSTHSKSRKQSKTAQIRRKRRKGKRKRRHLKLKLTVKCCLWLRKAQDHLTMMMECTWSLKTLSLNTCNSTARRRSRMLRAAISGCTKRHQRRQSLKRLQRTRMSSRLM